MENVLHLEGGPEGSVVSLAKVFFSGKATRASVTRQVLRRSLCVLHNECGSEEQRSQLSPCAPTPSLLAMGRCSLSGVPGDLGFLGFLLVASEHCGGWW